MDTLIISGAISGSILPSVFENKRFDHIIGVDGGLKFCYDHKIVPTRIVGDFDTLSPEILTWYKKNTQIEIREYNPVKDATDTQIAVELALSLEVIMLRFLRNRNQTGSCAGKYSEPVSGAGKRSGL